MATARTKPHRAALTADRAALTAEQSAAIDTRDVAVALSAGAGCGKTFVLTERFLSYLEPTADDSPGGDRPHAKRSVDAAAHELGQLVAFTYTERAAREMRDRIRRKCQERLAAASDGDAAHWLRLLRELDTARVSTIHSFCTTFLRAHAVEAGLDPHFAVLDGAQVQTIAWELLDDVLRTHLENRAPSTMRLAARYGLASLRDRVLAMLYHRDHEQFARFRTAKPADLVERWQAYAAARRQRELEAFGQSPAAVAAIAYVTAREFHEPKIAECTTVVAARLPGFAQSSDFLADREALRKATLLPRGTKVYEAEGIDADEYKSVMKSLRDAIDALKHIELDPAASLVAADYGLAILELACQASDAFAREKQRLGVVDFDDLLLKTRALLTGADHAELRRRVARSIRVLLVDESQDTDPVQAVLIDALCEGGARDAKLFFVGDYKQSIYRFMGAEPRLFHERRASVDVRGRLPLSRNFRSQPSLIALTNYLFAGQFAAEYQPLVAHRAQVTDTPNVEFLWATPPQQASTSPPPGDPSADTNTSDTNTSDTKPSAASARTKVHELRALEADWIARRLAGLVERREPIVTSQSDGQWSRRPIEPRDIVLLFRALSDVDVYEEALRRHGLDYYLVGGRAFYSQQEVFDVTNLLRALVSPCDEVSLAGALRSPLFNLCDESLFWLAQHEDGLAGAVLAAANGGALPGGLVGVERAAARRAAEILGDLRAVKDRLSIAELLQRAIEQTGYDAALLCEFLGERKLANLNKLVDMARSFDALGTMSLADFVVQLSEFVADRPKEALAATETEAGNVIRLMTIHQAKGLEFPLVVVVDCDRAAPPQRTTARFHPELGPLVGLPPRDLDDDQKKSDPTIGLKLASADAQRDDADEAVRLFYVAVTRAADYLILSAAMNDLDKPVGQWTRQLAVAFDLASGKTLASDAVAAGGAPVRVAVTLSMPEPDRKSAAKQRGASLAALADRIEHAAGNAGSLKQPGATPATAYDAIAPNEAARSVFSFSRLHGLLQPASIAAVDAIEAAPPLASPRGDNLGAEPDSGRLFTAVDLGSLVHRVIERLKWDGTDAVDALVARELERMSSHDRELAADAARLVAQLLAAPLAGEMRSARQRHSEVEFLLRWQNANNDAPRKSRQPINRASAAACDPAAPLLHGFLDALIQDAAGAWHVIDYKTNRVTPGNLATVAAGYELQMLLYGLAAERALGVAPLTVRLFFLQLGVEQRLAWTPAAAQRAVEQIEAAIRSARTVAGASPPRNG
jgi:ATP-dependent helicase/nuclease subunit A